MSAIEESYVAISAIAYSMGCPFAASCSTERRAAVYAADSDRLRKPCQRGKGDAERDKPIGKFVLNICTGANDEARVIGIRLAATKSTSECHFPKRGERYTVLCAFFSQLQKYQGEMSASRNPGSLTPCSTSPSTVPSAANSFHCYGYNYFITRIPSTIRFRLGFAAGSSRGVVEAQYHRSNKARFWPRAPVTTDEPSDMELERTYGTRPVPTLEASCEVLDHSASDADNESPDYENNSEDEFLDSDWKTPLI
ncbi:hypothetical protein C8J56DRAFT_886514 [Mycena floridula]|nr:hypothetical protein C8J56DRAFT_886514 [Mycena floridula]